MSVYAATSSRCMRRGQLQARAALASLSALATCETRHAMPLSSVHHGSPLPMAHGASCSIQFIVYRFPVALCRRLSADIPAPSFEWHADDADIGFGHGNTCCSHDRHRTMLTQADTSTTLPGTTGTAGNPGTEEPRYSEEQEFEAKARRRRDS